MSMIASDNGGASIPKLEGGVYTAISSAIVDLGIQKSEKFGKVQRRFMLIWNIQGEEVEVNGEKLPRTMSKEYGFSLNEKSILRKDLQAWRGKAFSDEELKGFDLLTILNKACQLQIILEERNSKQYNNIAGIMSLPKGMIATKLDNTYYLDITNMETFNNWSKVPTWIQAKIKKAENYEESGLRQYVDQYEKQIKANEEGQDHELEIVESDDLPF